MACGDIRYAVTADGVSIAYATRGAGPEDLVFIPGFAACFDIELEEPHFARLIEGMAARWRVVLFDKRGSGLSDRQNTPDLEMRADDLRAVLDAVGSEAAILVGAGEGGALAAFFAATHPERVTALVPVDAWARIAWATDYPMGMPQEAYVADTEDLAKGWGTVEYAREWAQAEMPSWGGDEGFVRWMARAMRYAASPAAALEFQHVWYATDVRSVLGSIQTPTLVMAGDDFTGGALIPVDAAAMSQYLTDHIPGAVFESFPGGDMGPYIADPHLLIEPISRFVESHRAEQQDFDRVLATVLFTDIVGSTEQAAQMGDREWKHLLERHHQVVRAMLGRYRGMEVSTAGDGFFTTFDGPARAVRCAQATVAAVKPLGIEIRAGVHTGEIERMADNVGGMAVHIGARVGAFAGPSEVLVSSTVRDLVVGSELEFDDLGPRVLKGVPGEWRLYQARATNS
jgi:pimeloyl-ACP methyl ester carboxylesterase/class 3 adenylate cyclase